MTRLTPSTPSPDHDRLRANLAALASGRLRGDERSEIEAHLAHCEDCAAVLAIAREIAALTPHPGVTALREFAVGQPSTKLAEIEAHVQRCAACSLEVASWRRGRPSRSRAYGVLGAAGLVAAGLLLWFWLVPFERAPPSGQDTPPQVLTFSGAMRGSEPGSIAAIDPRVELLIRAEWIPLDPFDEIGPLSLEIAPQGGPVGWSHQFDAPRVAQILRAGEGFNAVVPAGSLATGVHEFTMTRVSRPDEPPVIQGRFVVRGPAGQGPPGSTDAPR